MINLKVSVGSNREGISKTPNIQGKKAIKEPEVRPEYIEKIKRIEKANKKPIIIKNIDDLLVDE